MSINTDNNAYRRGVLLGLTMAEIITLIVFLLLLCFATILSKEKKINNDLNALSRNKDTVQRIAKVFSSAPPDMEEDIVRAIEALPTIISMIKDKETAQPEEKLQQTIVRAIDNLPPLRDNTNASIEEKLQIANQKNTDLEATIKNLTGQNKNLISQINGQGRGVDWPPCWPDAGGRATEYLFNIDLTSSGIIVIDSTPPNRLTEKSHLPLEKIKYNTPRAPSQFLSETKPIFDWSKSNECRFYVFVRDKTASSEKALFKNLLLTVESSFYKKLSQEFPNTQKAVKSKASNNSDDMDDTDASNKEHKSFLENIFTPSQTTKNRGYN